MSKRKHITWLHQQIPNWVQSGLISDKQAAGIGAMYPIPQSNLARLIFSCLGGLLIGLAVILFFAYNWQAMHRFFKLFVIFISLIVVHCGSLWFLRDQSKNFAASEGLALLGTVLFGSAIWLISQIYHIDSHLPDAFMLWGTGGLLMAWARKSLTQALATLFLYFIWGALEVFTFSKTYHLSAWVILIGLAPLAWLIHSKLLMFSVLLAFSTLWLVGMIKPLDESFGYVLFAFSVIFIMLGQLISRFNEASFSNFSSILKLPGYGLYLMIVFILTFSHFEHHATILDPYQNTMQGVYFYLSLGMAMALSLSNWAPLPRGQSLSENSKIHSCLILITIATVYTIGPGLWSPYHGVIAGLMNMIFIGHCLLFILQGSQLQKGWTVAFGCVCLSCLVLARYVDLFESLLSRSLAFLVLGLALFFIGGFYSRQKATVYHKHQGAAS